MNKLSAYSNMLAELTGFANKSAKNPASLAEYLDYISSGGKASFRDFLSQQKEAKKIAAMMEERYPQLSKYEAPYGTYGEGLDDVDGLSELGGYLRNSGSDINQYKSPRRAAADERDNFLENELKYLEKQGRQRAPTQEEFDNLPTPWEEPSGGYF